tara:strand:+ start:2906 stop:3430 length:525 start_codon:yes stop_codon:yes gene_type:complete
MLIEEIMIILVVILIIGGIIYLINKQVYDFNIFKRAVILQDINLEKKFNKMDKDYNKIKDDTNDINNRLSDRVNVDCLGKFSVCDKNTEGNCVKQYKRYREKSGEGKDCKYEDGHKESCPDGGGNCEVNQDCEGKWDESTCDTNNVKTFKVLKNGRGISCSFKHGDTEFCNKTE